MHLLNMIVGFTAAASAIDIYLNINSQDCNASRYYRCVGLRENTCCGNVGGEGLQSIFFDYIPKTWVFTGRVHGGGKCNNDQQIHHPKLGTTKFCVPNGNGWFTGAGYDFYRTVKHRSLGERADEGESADKKCVQPTEFGYDGQVYSIAGLDEAAILDLTALVANGTAEAELPAALQGRSIA